MGLDTTHNAFHGAYSAFNRFRQCVAEAIGGSFPDHYEYGLGGAPIPVVRNGKFGPYRRKPGMEEHRWYWGEGYSKETHPGLYEFFMHEDCDGEISPEMCVKVADELEALLPAIEALGWNAFGHIARDGGFVAVTQRFIDGCRAAAAEGEPLDFH